MKKTDETCPCCSAGFQRIELSSKPGMIAEYRCPNCDTSLEKFDGEHLVAYRITVRPVRLAASKM